MKINRNLINVLRVLPVLLFLIFSIWIMGWVRQEKETEDATQDLAFISAKSAYEVSFSMPSGFYDESILLTIAAPDNVTVYYTLDGSEPDTSSTVYTKPLQLTEDSWQENSYGDPNEPLFTEGPYPGVNENRACILRAVGIDKNDVATDVATATYFIDYDRTDADFNIMSIVTDPDNLFDSAIGIYVLGDGYESYVENGGDPSNKIFANFHQNGPEWERPAHIDYFDNEQTYLFSQETGMRINGNSSRESSRKSLRLYARKKYDGNGRFTYPFFKDGLYENSVILRKGSFTNQFLPSLVYDRSVATQKFVPCILFLNGIYWGEYCLLQRYDEAYIDTQYNVDEDNVTMLKDGELMDGASEIYGDYEKLLDFISTNDLSIPENYEYICSQLDIKSYIDYYSIQIYLNNYDFCSTKNILMWRSNVIDEKNPYADNRWRYSLYDLDFTLTAYGDRENYMTNSFSDPYAVVTQSDELLMRSFLANEDFRRQFVTTFMDLENVNFRFDTVAEKIDYYNAYVENGDLWKEFFEKRPEYINKHLADTFSLTGTLTNIMLTANDASQGSIQINTVVPDLNEGSWTGLYYSDYPVTLTALPKEGYRFKNWILDGVSFDTPELSVSLEYGDVSVSAVFEAIN